MSLDGKAIAIEIGFIFKHHYYSYMGAFDLAWRDYSPGKVQMREMISLVHRERDRPVRLPRHAGRLQVRMDRPHDRDA